MICDFGMARSNPKSTADEKDLLAYRKTEYKKVIKSKNKHKEELVGRQDNFRENMSTELKINTHSRHAKERNITPKVISR